ncbi:MAG: rhamnulokinase [Opitutales bacterium]|nr:rhamnulokinase [Opitutales bacterium]
MRNRKVYLAADVGAGSGRVLAAIFEERKVFLEEIRRFDNQPVSVLGSLHWDVLAIFSEIKRGIREAVKRYGRDVISIGVDTWGVDFGLIDAHGRLVGLTYCYRDTRTSGMDAVSEEILPQSQRYAIAGIQHLHFNSIYQLLAESRLRPNVLAETRQLLFIPDLLNYWLCGVAKNEVTIASTSELLEAKTGRWSDELIGRFGFPRGIFGELVEPGSVLGKLSPEVASEVGSDHILVVASPSHDTAAAVAACPLRSVDAVYISSGTWSLVGVESANCHTSDLANSMGLTNERGVEGTTRLLKNISGFWIFQQCKRDWDLLGLGLSYDALRDLATKEAPFQAFLDPSDPCFEAPGNMLARVNDYFAATAQRVEPRPGLITRTIFEGLALSYRRVLKGISRVTGKHPDTIHIMGGGSQNDFLNQLAADATGCTVLAGPLEGSSLGNVLSQLKADGEIPSIRAGRSIIADSFALRTFTPNASIDWDSAARQFDALVAQ